jgi:hypothetical protein
MGQFQTRRFTDPAPDAVSLNGFSQSPWRCETHARSSAFRIGKAERREERSAVTRPVIVDLSEFSGAKKADTLGKA